MIKIMQKSAFLMALLGLLLVSAAPNAMAKDKNCKRRGYVQTVNNYDDDDYRRDRSYERRRRNRDYDDDYYNREATTGNAVKRTAIGAGIGAVGGALIGGKKGAAIGAAAGAGGGYLYHRHKVKKERERY